jgi:hypothetical protein
LETLNTEENTLTREHMKSSKFSSEEEKEELKEQ